MRARLHANAISTYAGACGDVCGVRRFKGQGDRCSFGTPSHPPSCPPTALFSPWPSAHHMATPGVSIQAFFCTVITVPMRENNLDKECRIAIHRHFSYHMPRVGRLQTQISWNSIRKYGRVCTRLLCTVNSNLFTYYTMRRTAESFQFAQGR